MNRAAAIIFVCFLMRQIQSTYVYDERSCGENMLQRYRCEPSSFSAVHGGCNAVSECRCAAGFVRNGAVCIPEMSEPRSQGSHMTQIQSTYVYDERSCGENMIQRYRCDPSYLSAADGECDAISKCRCAASFVRNGAVCIPEMSEPRSQVGFVIWLTSNTCTTSIVRIVCGSNAAVETIRRHLSADLAGSFCHVNCKCVDGYVNRGKRCVIGGTQ